MKRSDDVVSASEIASWAWCPESWRLNALGSEPTNRGDIARGELEHRRKATYERFSRRVVALGWLLLLCGGLSAFVALALVGLP